MSKSYRHLWRTIAIAQLKLSAKLKMLLPTRKKNRFRVTCIRSGETVNQVMCGSWDVNRWSYFKTKVALEQVGAVSCLNLDEQGVFNLCLATYFLTMKHRDLTLPFSKLTEKFPCPHCIHRSYKMRLLTGLIVKFKNYKATLAIVRLRYVTCDWFKFTKSWVK